MLEFAKALRYDLREPRQPGDWVRRSELHGLLVYERGGNLHRRRVRSGGMQHRVRRLRYERRCPRL
jgi:hypothetical protein